MNCLQDQTPYLRTIWLDGWIRLLVELQREGSTINKATSSSSLREVLYYLKLFNAKNSSVILQSALCGSVSSL